MTGTLEETGNQSRAVDEPVYQDLALQITFGVALMAVLRPDSVTPAFPLIARTFDRSSQEIGLLITFFALPSVFLTPVLGVLADRWGRKRILVPSLFLFGLAGGLSMFVRNFELLLGLRLLHGVGAAALSMLNITLVADLYAGRNRTAAIGYNASIRSLGSTVFPLVGGALAVVGWQYPFALAWLAIPTAWLVWRKLENPEPSRATDFRQYMGQMAHSVQSWKVVALLAAGCVVFVVMFGGYLNYFPFLLEGTFGAPAWVIGVLVSGRSVINLVIASQLGRMTRFVSVEMLLKASLALYGIAFAMIPLMPNLETMALVTLVLGAAEGLYWPSSQALLGSWAPLANRASFLAANDMVLKSGQTLGPLLMGAVFGRGGVSAVFYLAAGCSLLAFLLAAGWIGSPRNRCV